MNFEFTSITHLLCDLGQINFSQYPSVIYKTVIHRIRNNEARYLTILVSFYTTGGYYSYPKRILEEKKFPGCPVRMMHVKGILARKEH